MMPHIFDLDATVWSGVQGRQKTKLIHDSNMQKQQTEERGEKYEAKKVLFYTRVPLLRFMFQNCSS